MAKRVLGGRRLEGRGQCEGTAAEGRAEEGITDKERQ